MVYKLIQYILRAYLPVFFKRIEYRGLENVPKDKPVIFAVNHQNAFLDGILVALKLRREIFFLTRSDVFKGKWVIRIFKALNLIPIFRRQDGHDNIQNKNNQTFNHCIKELANKKCILIFPEGVSEPVHHLFKLKKGVARLAFEAEEAHNFNLKLHIVPVAINYENHFIGGKKVYVNYCNPIIVSDYKQEYEEAPSKARNIIINKLESELQNNMIHIEGDYAKFKRKYWKGIIRQSRNDKEMIAAVKSIPNNTGSFTTKGLRWWREKYKYNKPRSAFSRLVYAMICLPGVILYSPTLIITKLLVAKIKDESFYLSVNCLSWLVFGFTQTIIAGVYIWNYTGADIFFTAMVLMLFFALLALRNFYKPMKTG